MEDQIAGRVKQDNVLDLKLLRLNASIKGRQKIRCLDLMVIFVNQEGEPIYYTNYGHTISL